MVGKSVRASWACGVVLLASACGQGGASGRDGADASIGGDASPALPTAASAVLAAPARVPVPMPAPVVGANVRRSVGDARPEHPTLAAVRRQIAGEKALAARFIESARALTAADEGFVSEAWRKPSARDWSHLGAVLPQHANDFVRVGPARVERWSMALEPLGHSDATAISDAGRVVYEEALHHTDLVATSGERWVEQIYFLKDASAPTTFQWKLHLGRDLRRDPTPSTLGQIHFVDREGHVALRIEAPYAIDATGKHVAATLAFHDDTMSISIDPSGLAYPIAVDPLIDVPVWTQVTTATTLVGDTGGICYAGMAYAGSATELVLTTGTMVDGTYGYLDKSYAWNGSDWTSLAIGAPLATHASVVEDSNGGVTVLGGTMGGATPAAGAVANEIFEWPHTGSFNAVCPNGGPCAVALTADEDYRGAYLGRPYGTIFFGFDGFTYLYNPYPSSAAPQLVTPAPTTVPPNRRAQQMSGDLGTGHAVMFSGRHETDATPIDDAWEFIPSGTTGGNWTLLCGEGSTTECPPVPRTQGMMAYDYERKVSVLTGGNSGSSSGATYLNDVWEYDDVAHAWTQLAGVGDPSTLTPRAGAAMGYDISRKQMVVVGGSNGGVYLSDTWTMYMRSGTCTTNGQCDTGLCEIELIGGVATGTCCDNGGVVCPTCKTCANPSNPGVCVNVAADQPDPSTTTSHNCASGGVCDGSGNCKLPPGASCGAGSQCGSGYCVNSTCCQTSTCGTGLTCATSDGSCRSSLGQACVSNGTCASTYCANSVCCNSACTTSGFACNLSGSVGTCMKALGTACGANAECASNNCVDGVCCNTSCSGQCEACNSAAASGTCLPVTGNAVGSRAACAGFGTSCGASCNGTDVNACHAALTTTTCGSASCSAGVATPVGNCDGAGNCSQPPASCGSYVCGGSACKTSCATDADCSSATLYCSSAGQCVPKLALGTTCSGLSATACASGACVSGVCCGSSSAACASPALACNFAREPGTCAKTNGQACASAAECGSGNCVDGVCCDQACNGQCQACDVAGSVGKCIAVTGAPHATASPARPSCGGSGPCAAVCDGADVLACHDPGSSLSCGAASCSGGLATAPGQCDGKGNCTQVPTSCAPYNCGATACNASCSADSDCASGDYCSGGHCVAQQPLGNTCTGDDACQVGSFCVGGICCNSTCTTSGFACNLPGSLGTCTKANGTACGASGECASGFCVDGVCCNSACGGECQACDVSVGTVSYVGTCSTVVGKPHGSRPACATGAAGCGATCDGTHWASCTFPGASAVCGNSTCTNSATQDATYTSPGTCDGTGKCNAGSGDCGPYECTSPTGACKSSCGSNADCSPGNYCSSGKCVPDQGLGVPCSDPSQCGNGQCVNGVCCAASACAVGASCAATTASAGHCTTLQGYACASDGQCATGHCVDGFCCDTACTGSCEACAESGHVGTCVPVVGAPRTGHATCATPPSPTDPGCGLSCNGTDATLCHLAPSSTACGTPSCNAGRETDVSSCDGAGHCTPATKPCAPYVCGATSCLGSCTADSDCATGSFCASGTCAPKQSIAATCTANDQCATGFCTNGVCCNVASCNDPSMSCNGSSATAGACTKLAGAVCASATDCASGFCVDGVCCSSSCSAPCEACAEPGNAGTCVPVLGQPRSGHGACSATATDPTCGLSCNGVDVTQCNDAPTTTACGVPSCASGTEVDVSSCDGAGNCPAVTKKCAPYACGAKACLTTCSADADCVSGNYCAAGSCVPVLALGATCSANDQCASTFCTDGVCCGVASCGAGAACGGATAATPGACFRSNSTACAAGTDCASGHCTDGVCCDLACDGQCEACDIAGSAGACTPVTGAPHGSRPICDAKSATDCAKTTCDGSTRSSCGGFANNGTTPCGSPSCTSTGQFQAGGFCDGHGGCTVPAPATCVPFACSSATNACAATCTTDMDCATGYKCDPATNTCVQGTVCSADNTTSIAKDGTPTDCKPYVCGGQGTCQSSCGASSDCQPPAVCDVTAKVCVETTTTTSSSGGGCSFSTTKRRQSPGAVAFGLALAALAWRRRRSVA